MNNFVEQQKQKNAMKQNKNILRAALLLLLGIAAPEARAQQLITDNGDGTYTITMPDRNVTVTADVKKLLAHKDISVSLPQQDWTGNELTPVITVKDGETVLTLDEDYTVTAPSGPIQDSGNYTYTITGQGNYAGSREVTFTIMPAKIANATIQFSASSFEYNGSPIKPELTLMDGETEVPNTEYTVSYADNVNAGTATVTIEDLPGGNYALASVSKTYEIGKATVTVTAADQTKGYGDTDPELTYTADGLVGSDEISGTLGRTDGEDVGNHDINLGSLNAGSNYTLILAGNGAKLTITPKSLKDQNIEIGIKDYASCSVEVKQDGVLIADNNYTAAKHATKENTVTVTGTGNYAGEIDVTLVSANFEKPADAATDADCCAAAQVSQDMALPEGMVAVMLTGTDPQKGIASAKTLDYIPAGVPVILMKKDDVDGFTGKDITPGATSGTTEVTNAEKAACPLKVADGNTENLQGYQDYVWFKGELVMVSNTAKPANGTFYVKNSTPNSAPRLQIVIGEEEVTTSLTPNPSPKGEGSGYWYTLDGQKMDKQPTKKGLYIKNGRKVVIK